MMTSASALNRASVDQVVGVVTDADAHLAFIKQILKKYVSSEVRKRELFQKALIAHRRAKDPILHVAVLGEFSSGKSTFINALLRHRLLKSARVATTASATYITYGPTLQVAATFLDGRRIRGSAKEISELFRVIAELKTNRLEICPIRGLIDFLTADPEVANFVNRVDIALPNKNLQSGLSIIDTPGIGAGSDYTQRHAGITQSVVENSADAAIVLIPSAQPMSHTLINFLQTVAHHFLHRCIFVVTATDTQEKVDRSTTLKFVRQCLIEKLCVENPTVLECAAVTALPKAIAIPAYSQSQWTFWQQQFAELESKLLQTMLRQRNLIISEKLIYLLQTIFSELEADVKTWQHSVEVSAITLSNNSVTAIEDVLSRLLSEGILKIQQQSKRCSINVLARKSKLKASVKNKVNNVIDGANWDIVNNYSGVVKPKIEKAVDAEGQRFLNDIDTDIQPLSQCLESVSANFQYQFEQSYKTLKALDSNIVMPAASISSVSVSSIGFSSAGSFIQQVHTEDVQRTGRGAAIGAAIGILGGSIGMVAGAAIGGAIGHSSGNDLETYRRGIKLQVSSDVDSYIEKAVAEVTSAINTLTRAAISDFEAMVETHLSEYRAAVNIMIQKHKQKEQQLVLRARGIGHDMNEIEWRKRKLERLNAKLFKL